jgi:pathogenesis-related protein 1
MIPFFSHIARLLLICVFAVTILACSEDKSGGQNGGVPQPPPAPPSAPPPAPPPTTELDCTTIMPGTSLVDDFVCAHNAIRASVQTPQPLPEPPLPEVIWNQQLADFAQFHADACVYAHSDNTERTNKFGQWVGENIAANTGQGYDPYFIVNLWASEAVDYDYTSNTCADAKQCGHYTQIVWRETTEVGCAKASCPTLSNTSFTDAEFWICDYLPGGNYVGQRPY